MKYHLSYMTLPSSSKTVIILDYSINVYRRVKDVRGYGTRIYRLTFLEYRRKTLNGGQLTDGFR